MDNLYQILPVVAALMFLISIAVVGQRPAVDWRIPAAISPLFFIWSLHAVATGGQTGFWVEHTRNAWGNQIWFDLLIGVGIAWSLLVPRARAVGMRIWPWLALIAATGGIGLSAMFARCLYLEARSA